MGLTEHQAKQLHAARKHSSMRESAIRAAIGVKGGLKHLLPEFTITIPEGEDTPKFREHYDGMEWEMACQRCTKKSSTSYHEGKLLCRSCIDYAQSASGR